MNKKILYVHGLGSSGNSRTSKILREYYKDDDVISPDIPFEPCKAMALLNELVLKEQPDVIVGSSLGAFYAMQLQAKKKILVNPALYADIDLESSIGKGTYNYFSSREDGIQSYTIDEEYLSSLKKMRENFFNGDTISDTSITGLFGTKDELFSHIDDFKKVFPNANLEVHEFSHRLTETDIKNYLIPLINKQ